MPPGFWPNGFWPKGLWPPWPDCPEAASVDWMIVTTAGEAFETTSTTVDELSAWRDGALAAAGRAATGAPAMTFVTGFSAPDCLSATTVPADASVADSRPIPRKPMTVRPRRSRRAGAGVVAGRLQPDTVGRSMGPKVVNGAFAGAGDAIGIV